MDSIWNPIIAAAPQVSLGPFAGVFERVRPLLIVFFVLAGMYVAIALISGYIHRAAKVDRNGEMVPMGFMDLVHRLGAVTGTVLLGVLVVTYGIDILNYLLQLIFSVTSEIDAP